MGEQEVHTTLGYFTEVPTLVTSISGRSHHWMVTGAGAIYDAKAQSFKVYLDKAKSAAFAKEHDWRVNYIAYSTPVDCVVQGWDEVSYGECSATCGPLGRKTKTRKVVTKAYFGGTCNDELELAVACNTDPCPIDCAWQAWSTWGSCSVTCAEGQRSRTRTYAPNACPNGEHKCHGGKECEGNADDSITCNEGPCPIDCEMELWSSWGSCSVTCGAAGRRTRTRGIKVSPQHNGASCPGMTETGPCLQADENDWWTQDCPDACTLSAWGDWGNFINGDVWSKQCSTGTCGAGTWSHRREILQQPYYGANNEYNLAKWKSQLNLDCESQTPGTCANGWCSESAPCNVNNPCPIDCEQSAWVPLDEEDAVCTKTCGGGKRYQHRTVTIEAQHGVAPCGAATRTSALLIVLSLHGARGSAVRVSAHAILGLVLPVVSAIARAVTRMATMSRAAKQRPAVSRQLQACARRVLHTATAAHHVEIRSCTRTATHMPALSIANTMLGDQATCSRLMPTVGERAQKLADPAPRRASAQSKRTASTAANHAKTCTATTRRRPNATRARVP